MAALMRSIDWAKTPLGPVSDWPQSLRTALSILLTSRSPIFIFWGKELVQFYNDAYRPILGDTKHPRAMGQRGPECWVEIWDVIEPLTKAVLERGESTYIEDGLLCISRYGFPEEGYYTYAYSPIRDESGIGGIFCTVTDTTDRVIGDRRLRTLRDLGARTLGTKAEAEACEEFARILGANAHDAPFAAIYLVDRDRREARLAARAGEASGGGHLPATLPLDGDGAPWPIGRAAEGREAVLVEDVVRRAGEHCGLVWPEPISKAVLLPVTLPGQESPCAVLVFGLSPRLAFDEKYRGFTELVRSQLVGVLASARAYAEERRRAEALAELDRAKTAFFSNVSHEFRTPLTLMLGPLEDVLSAERSLTPQGRNHLETARRNALRLLKLTNSLLDFSRVEAGRVRATYEPVDLPALTRELSSVFRSAVEKAGLAFVVDCPPFPEPVWVDRDMWEKIVLNLLSNALKFTFEGTIEVRLRAEAGRAELAVRDTGTGIPEGEMPRLFERFHRIENARSRTHEGSGIGLALVQELAKLHGGTVRAESVLGKGTTFTVSVPFGNGHLAPERLAPASPRPAATALRADAFLEEALRWLPGGEPGEPAPSESDAPGLSPAVPGRILVVDDNADMRDYLVRILGARWEVGAAPNGRIALDRIRTRPPDLVLSDVMMPELDGFGLLRELRGDEATRTLPVILLSARAGEDSRIDGLARGADDYLIKPFSTKELVSKVESSLRLSAVRREHERDLRDLNAALERRVRERTAELEAANRELEAFSYSVSHDLRAPLRGIDGFSGFLLAKYKNNLDDRGKDYLTRIIAAARRMERLIDDFMKLSQIAGTDLEVERVDLSALALGIGSELRQKEPERAVEVIVQPGVEARGDPRLLRIVLDNLIENAWKFTRKRPRARIEFEAVDRSDELAYVVRDNGEGFDMAYAGKLFQPFERLHSADDFPGTGIGLATVRRIVARHGGRAWAEGAAGEGAEFYFTLGTDPGKTHGP